MLKYLIVMLSLSGLCAGWVLFQMWLRKHSSRKSGQLFENRCSSCGAGACTKDRPAPNRPSSGC